MYDCRKGANRQRFKSQIAHIKRDYAPYVLGLYKYGLNQKAPLSNDPNASEARKFTQLPNYRFAESNAPFM